MTINSRNAIQDAIEVLKSVRLAFSTNEEVELSDVDTALANLCAMQDVKMPDVKKWATGFNNDSGEDLEILEDYLYLFGKEAFHAGLMAQPDVQKVRDGALEDAASMARSRYNTVDADTPDGKVSDGMSRACDGIEIAIRALKQGEKV